MSWLLPSPHSHSVPVLSPDFHLNCCCVPCWLFPPFSLCYMRTKSRSQSSEKVVSTFPVRSILDHSVTTGIQARQQQMTFFPSVSLRYPWLTNSYLTCQQRPQVDFYLWHPLQGQVKWLLRWYALNIQPERTAQRCQSILKDCRSLLMQWKRMFCHLPLLEIVPLVLNL